MKFPTLLECLKTVPSLITQDCGGYEEDYMALSEKAIEFYSQPLALWMFITCSEDGKPMSKPIHSDPKYSLENFDATKPVPWAVDCTKYNEAVDRVLFEGWVLTQNTGIKRLRKDRYTIRLSDKTGQCTVEGAQRFIAKEIFSLDGFINTVPFLTPPNQQRSN